ncbi:ABC transporter ATP-binding protein/permease [Catenibacterium mitsuokai]|uniref:ABC transporter ATP-binding protein/permease n=1 Tax=Catenibacterium mitsuokai TaxID=100886 RepID=A0AAW4MWK2_9FIRM|nr:ABC transporter ATP-binding protein [Catenibacterium mitsuokai]MBV3367099.1 ABC transporter ATP-binding protein/permease [Catenibacterium mitsuokai]MBV3371216.1 ABC transporter ATP-binding protein/permease [Catenibacterium mitsuokai]MBV3376514.1 ABC transporter ATP-binding protein/permease [Catenibacterium mitsuokai]MBV3378653.1 ABC transporter ATP-binding protein/permease [Catenibacterium mitsuokai]MBV3381040.1 ABC transporter ATP-binding protein/permease [Catenibacterium mitsuokai]
MIRVLKKSIREYKRDSILTPILVAFESLTECFLPLMVATLVNKMQNGCDLSVIVKYGVILIIMACFSLLFGALAGITAANASAGFGKNLRKDLFVAVQNFSFENIDRFSASSLVTRMTTDVTNVQMAYMMIIRTVIRAPLMLIFSLIMGFVMGGRLALIFLFTIPVLGIGLGLVIKKTMPLFRKVFRKYDNLNNSVQENINGIRVVKSFVREDFEMKKFNTAAEDVCNDFTRAEKILALNNPMMQFCIYVVMIFVMTFGSFLVVNFGGAIIQVGQLSSLLTYSFQILMSLMMLSMVFVMVTISMESCERIVAVLEEKHTISNPKNPIYEVKDGSIDFNNVSFKYSKRADRYALANINLHIKSGQTIGILGGTGSSKTSLVNLISRLYDVTEGEVKVAGVNVKDYDLVTLRDAVSVVLQKNVLFSGSIKENLRWGNKDATDEEIVEACHLACADEFIEQFPDKYDTHIEQGGTNVSGGQKQRLCIARALLKKPKILILDDSTSAVDTKTDAIIRAGFKKFIPETTKIIIAQRVSSVQDADQIIIMNNGSIEAIGTHDELLASNPIYQEVYYSQNKGGEQDEK